MFSIITPVFNEQRYLDEMIQSVRAQTFTDWELVLVDDGSDDDTVDIIRAWQSRDSRVRLESWGTKLGKVAAFNLAFEAARGTHVSHVGGDDVLPPTSLRDRVDALPDPDELAVALGKLQVIDSDGAELGSPIPRGGKGSQSSPGATYTRALADLIFPVPESLPSEDIWLGNAAVECASRVVHLDSILTYYRVHQSNSNPRAKPFSEMTESIHTRLEALQRLSVADLPLTDQSRLKFQRRWQLEQFRYEGKLNKVLTYPHASVVDRVATSSMTRPWLWELRKRMGVRASGWRGK